MRLAYIHLAKRFLLLSDVYILRAGVIWTRDKMTRLHIMEIKMYLQGEVVHVELL